MRTTIPAITPRPPQTVDDPRQASKQSPFKAFISASRSWRASHPSKSAVCIRSLRAGEQDVLRAVFDGMSPRSRYRRYFTGIPVLTPTMTRRLAAVDDREHLAVVALAGPRPIGIARLVAVSGKRAELAVEVVDTWHGRGIGTRLVREVLDAGRLAGYTQIVGSVLVENVPMLALLASVFPDLHRHHEPGGVLEFTATLAAA